MLVNKNILKSKKGKVYNIFTDYISSDFVSDPTLPMTMKPSEYVENCWNRYIKGASPATYKRSRSINGKIFELIIATALYRSNILPFYCQATSKLVPDVDYDILLYDEIKCVPITLSMKTSARERYKQADLEAYAFKNVHRTAVNYLLMLEDCKKIESKILDGSVLALKKVIKANTSDFDDLINELSKRKLGYAPTITLFSGQLVN